MGAYIKWLTYRLLCFLLCLVSSAYGQNVYKSTDTNGNVSYTTTAPDKMDNVQTLAPPPEPSQVEIEAAKRRLTDIEQQNYQREQARMAQQLAETQAQSTHTVERTVERQIIPIPHTRRRPSVHPTPLPARPPASRPINRLR